jgi:hypothetical protein
MTATAERQQPRTWDFFLTGLLIVVLLALTGVYIVLGLGLGFGALGCTDSNAACNQTAITIGGALATFGTPVLALATIIVSAVFIAKRRIAFVVPLIGVLVVTGAYLFGAFLVSQAIPAG